MVNVWKKTTGITLGCMSDMHASETSGLDNVEISLEFAASRGVKKPKYFLLPGDLTIAPDNGQHQIPSWLEAKAGFTNAADFDWIEYPCCGNWDTKLAISNYTDPVDSDPFSPIKAAYPRAFRTGRDWYYVDIPGYSIRVVALQNNTDYVQGNGNTAYRNCNPGSTQFVAGPDFGGITINGSPQRQFLDNAMNVDRRLKIIMAHRAPYCPFDSDPRKMHRDCRLPLKTAIDRGATFGLFGDVHVGCFSGPWYPSLPTYDEKRADGEVGLWAWTGCGGYANRSLDVSVLPGYTSGDVENPANNPNLAWASGLETQERKVHTMFITMLGDKCEVEIYEVKNAPGDPDTKIQGIVHEQIVSINPGA